MRLLLDTNVVSELRKVLRGTVDPRFASWAESLSVADLAISAVTAQELELGVLLLSCKDPAAGAVLRSWLNQDVWQAFKGKILPFGQAEAVVVAKIQLQASTPFRDSYIAATAITANRTLVTRNTKDFKQIEGLDSLNPWE
jgi:predicted nucleic acid-binding protein